MATENPAGDSMRPNTLYYGDCLDWMSDWAEGCVDLIYLDPPFNSDANYNILFGAENGIPAQVRAFQDTWKWDAAAQIRVDELSRATAHPANRAIIGLHNFLGPSGMLAYLSYMAQRLPAMRNLLKPGGGIYLHCDSTASHYLKLLMDGIFGARNYLNNIVWRRATSHNDATRYGRITDHILYYAKDRGALYWNGDAARTQRSAASARRTYSSEDDFGRYRTADLTGARASGGESGQAWGGYDPGSRGRHWAPPKTGGYARFIEEHFISNYRSIEGVHDRLDALDKAGLIHHPTSGFWPGLKRYALADQGAPPQDLILDPTGFTNFSARRGNGEYLGYPTQKPSGLLEPLILAASPEGGLVLDPFCGGGTTIAAAETLNRRWVGIDIAVQAIDIAAERLKVQTGIDFPIQGIPTSIASARRFARDNPLDFEAWAITRIPGLVPNEIRTGDRGIDGRGRLLQRPEGVQSNLVIAQAKGGAFALGQLRDFLHAIEREQAAMGVFITLAPVRSRDARAECAAQGDVSFGAYRYPKAQLWSIDGLFAETPTLPTLPPLADPYTGRAMQGRLG